MICSARSTDELDGVSEHYLKLARGFEISDCSVTDPLGAEKCFSIPTNFLNKYVFLKIKLFLSASNQYWLEYSKSAL